jgi:signal transduction histidine kinase
MLSYLAFVHHGIESAGNPLADGVKLARHCLNKLEELGDAEQFPPRLLILLASPAYLDSLKSEQLLNGVIQAFEQAGKRMSDEADAGSVGLIGCSVSAVFFNRRIYRQGALLICLASRLLEARIQASPNADQDPDGSVKSLLHGLNLLTEEGDKVHSFANRTLLALFPGFGGTKYLAPKLHESLRRQLGARIAIFGGVASADDPHRVRSGILFANRKIYRKAIVAASVECGTPFGISLTQGLTDTNHIYKVAETDPKDGRVILRFEEGDVGSVMEEMKALSPMPLFANLRLDRDPTIDMPKLEGNAMRLAREVRRGESFHLVRPEVEKIQEAFSEGIQQSLRRAFLLNPIGALGFRCAGLLRHCEQIGLDPKYQTALIERDLSIRETRYDKPFVGGFVDGEAGVDENSKSVLGNWSNATLVFGDELRFRTPVYRGFEKLAEYTGRITPESHRKWIDRLTLLVYDIGFPGAMLSFCVGDQEQDTIVAQSASGSRFKKALVEVKPYLLDGSDLLADIARKKQWRFIPDSAQETCGSMQAASRAGVISQYITPLVGADGGVTAVLQIDLGDISYDMRLYQTEKTVLESLSKIVSSGLNRISNWEESKIIRALDRAMNDCLSAKTLKQGLQQYLVHALEAFGLEEGHVRLAQEDRNSLRLVAGVGDYFEETRKTRKEIDFGEVSPTAQAFRDEKVVIINDPPNNKAHREMRDLCENKPGLYQRLGEIGSYANVPFKSERGEQRGTINLLSSDRWSFLWFHRNALTALGDRIGFLVETLSRKERELFLRDVSPQYSQIQDINDIQGVLSEEIRRFAGAVKAEIASLYIWDDDRERHVLRAQHGWHRPEWVNAAFYTKDEVWTGTSALAGKPRYIPNLFDYYEKYRTSTHRYSEHAFGEDLSKEFTMEAIALQLRIADNRLGVLTFYSCIKEGDESGFITTDTNLLQQGADNFSSLIGILQADRMEKWRKREHVRRQEVYDATVSGARSGSGEAAGDFETRVCQQVLKSYRAVKACFYKVENSVSEPPEFDLKGSFRRAPRTGLIVEEVTEPAEPELELVKSTIYANRRNEKEMPVERVTLTDKEEDDPKRVALGGLVRRACVPLFSAKKLGGVLDLHWSFDPAQADSPDYQHGDGLLRMLGEVIGSAYDRDQTKVQAREIHAEAETKLREGKVKLLQSEDQTRNVVQATTAYVLQHHHELRTIVQRMSTRVNTLKALRKEADDKEKEIIEELSLKIKQGITTLKKMIEIGRRMSAPAYERLTLKSLIFSSLEKSEGNYVGRKVQVNPPNVLGDYFVRADPSLIGIAFTNLLDNSFNSMKRQKHRTLTIRAETAGNAEVTITVEDTGTGMSEEMIQRILKEFYSVNDRVSVGVMISRLILGLHGGRLNYTSVEGNGTTTVIALPLDYMEE